MKKKNIEVARLQDELSDREKKVIAERLGFKTRPLSREVVCDMFAISMDRLLEVEKKAVNLLIPMKTQKPRYISDELSDFQKEVIVERLGIGVDRKKEFHKSREEIAKKWNITIDIIRKIEAKAVNLLSE